MQNHKKYIVPFINITGDTYPARYINTLTNACDRFIKIEPHIKDKYELYYQAIQLPENYSQSRHYYLLKSFAKMVRVKIMWKDVLSIDATKSTKGVQVIGSQLRVNIWIDIIAHVFASLKTHKGYLKVATLNVEGKKKHIKDFRVYSSEHQAMLISILVNNIIDKLEDDKVYDYILERKIMSRFRLDYKKYKSKRKEYYYAISKKYHNRRMLL